MGKITIAKKWLDYNGKVIAAPAFSGDLFEIFKDGIKKASGTPDKNGMLCFENLELGEYTIKEKVIPGFGVSFALNGNETKSSEFKVKLYVESKEKTLAVTNKDITKPTVTVPSENNNTTTTKTLYQ